MLTIKAMVKKDGMRVDRKYNVKLSFTYKRKGRRSTKRNGMPIYVDISTICCDTINVLRPTVFLNKIETAGLKHLNYDSDMKNDSISTPKNSADDFCNVIINNLINI